MRLLILCAAVVVGCAGRQGSAPAEQPDSDDVRVDEISKGAADPTPTFSVVVEPLPVEPRTDPPPKIERGPDGIPLGRPGGGPLPPPPSQDLPFDRITPHAIYTPLPASKEIDPERAKSARPLEIGFCISPAGKTESIEVTASTRDLILDRLVRGSVRTWRFRALQLHGRAAWTCTQVRFRFVPQVGNVSGRVVRDPR